MTLVELLITLIIGGIIMGAVSLLFVAFFRNFNMHDDLAAAQQNGEMGLTLIESYVLQAGMGMPSISSTDFQEAFNIAPTPTWKNWNGSINTYSGDMALRVLAARSTKPSIGATEEKNIGTSVTSLAVMASPSFSGGASLGDFIAENDWIIFPASRLPFRVTATPSTNTDLQLECTSMDTVHLFDSLYVLKGVEFLIYKGDLVLSGDEGMEMQIQDISKMYVNWDDSSRLLQVVLLARGKEKLSHQVEPPPAWPSSKQPLTSEERHYRHVAVGRIWRIRN